MSPSATFSPLACGTLVSPAPDHRAVFLDRDGVLAVLAPDWEHPGSIALCDGAGRAVRRLNEQGWKVIVVTNQPAVARGLLSEDDVVAQNEALGSLVDSHGGPCRRLFLLPPPSERRRSHLSMQLCLPKAQIWAA